MPNRFRVTSFRLTQSANYHAKAIAKAICANIIKLSICLYNGLLTPRSMLTEGNTKAFQKWLKRIAIEDCGATPSQATHVAIRNRRLDVIYDSNPILKKSVTGDLLSAVRFTTTRLTATAPVGSVC
jgi:hypothetical protein